jgi:hypothetical protein
MPVSDEMWPIGTISGRDGTPLWLAMKVPCITPMLQVYVADIEQSLGRILVLESDDRRGGRQSVQDGAQVLWLATASNIKPHFRLEVETGRDGAHPDREDLAPEAFGHPSRQ